jgi:hypothetical protein
MDGRGSAALALCGSKGGLMSQQIHRNSALLVLVCSPPATMAAMLFLSIEASFGVGAN